MGCVLPQQGFLEGLRRVCDAHGALLIFDEVMTGFRVALGGAQARYGVTADLVTLGKVIGGGLPVGAYGGRADLMNQMAPVGPVYQAGTLSGNPLATAAGLATLALVQQPGFYERLEASAGTLMAGLQAIADAAGLGEVHDQAQVLVPLDRGMAEHLAHVQHAQAAHFQQVEQQLPEAVRRNGVEVSRSTVIRLNDTLHWTTPVGRPWLANSSMQNDRAK